MITTPRATPYAQAAQRARVIAETALDRFAGPGTIQVLVRISGLLEAAALFLDDEQPGPYVSVPVEATEALWKADTLAEEHPDTRFPEGFTNYVLHALTGRPLPFPAPLHPVSDRMVLREIDLRNRLSQLHADTEQQAARPDEWLRAVLTTWQKHMRLATEVRVDNARPCNQS
ncbi:hypothetical protein ABTY59_32015 [Streptomyces sp. NPDC096079]|uniref:hypothetical protein n=1 Tax=Streptomyces sp. NPDC096079 TaxID=3155820 RepID=UPI0033248B2E